jgi:hypothetical protein
MGRSFSPDLFKGEGQTFNPHSLAAQNSKLHQGKGEATIEEMIERLNLTEEELRREFAVLRHMEVLRATKKGEKIFYILF